MNPNQQTIKQVVIIGGGYAGTLAALRLAGKTSKIPVQITLVNGTDVFLERIRLHQLAANEPIPLRPLAEIVAKTGIRFVQGWVTAVSPQQSTLTLHTKMGEQQMTYDTLIYALGSSVDTSVIPGIQEYTYTLGSQQLQQVLPDVAAKNGRLLIIGAGLTGIEAATEIAEAYPGLQVIIATRGPFGGSLSSRGAAHIRQVFKQLAITLAEETAVSHIEPYAAHTTDGRILPFDLCLWTGAFSVPTLARESGLPVNVNGRLRVTPSLQVENYPNIYAIGDAADTPLRMACATAMPMGAYAADHLAARLKHTKLPAPFRFAYISQCISLGRRQGLIQFVHTNDTPKERILTGKTAVIVKELICRFTIWSLKLEKRIPGSYIWAQADIINTQTAIQTSSDIAVSFQK